MTHSSLDDLDSKINDAHRIIEDALDQHLAGRRLVGRVVLFSGGNDSTTLTHLLRGEVTHAAHANTTIGVERTRQFVRDTCASWGLPLIERQGALSYAELVLGSGGFPGPAMHYRMYQRLKERALREVRRELVINPRQERVLFIAGRRRAESSRRAEVPEHEREGSMIWASPLANWTAADLAAYRSLHAVPRNPVADDLGMSGECLCGAFAEPGEYERIAEVDADAADAIRSLEHALAEAGHTGPRCQWGWGAYRADPSAQAVKVGPLCSSCDARWTPTPVSTDVVQQIMSRRRAARLEDSA